MKQAHNDYRACKRDVRVVDAVRIAEHVPDHGRWEGHDDPDECATPVAEAWSIESQQHENGQRRTEPLSKVSNVENVVRAECDDNRSEEHTSELQSLMRISYAVFCLKKKKQQQQIQ